MSRRMGKRKISSSEADFSEIDLSDSDDQFDVSSRPKTRGKSAPRRQPTKKRTKHDLGGANDVSLSGAPPTHAKSTHVMKAAEIPSIRAALVQWYSGVHASRNMPWRKPYNPTLGREERAQRAYEVWISEIMLQQTQVATVIPYYNRWLEKFPTIRDLAAASIDEVNSLWKGLGYYSRASRLLAGAKKAVDEYGGRLPDNAKDMQANIPGIGRYSAGAICSIAYGENVPVLDGNVNRLLSRLLALHALPKAKTTLDILWNAADAMVQDLGSAAAGSTSIEYPGDVNQALIELGSTVCKVRDPGCESCPLRTWCSAYTATKTNSPTIPVIDIEDLCKICEPLIDEPLVTAYPMKADKKKAREELDIVNVVEWRFGSDRHFLLVRRPEVGLLAGLDEFPTSPNVPSSMSRARQSKIPQEILSTLLHSNVRLLEDAPKSRPDTSNTSLRITKVQSAGDVVHVFSHIKKTYRVQWVLLEGTPNIPPLASANDSEKNPNAAKSKGKGKPRKTDNESDKIPCSTWVPLNEVAAKNIGTGTMKVWNLCRTLWEEEE
ncbi:DNA glycosylase [Mycena capillaripes]|nr:DNA glycosylase [Mycena capillaripes]